MYTISELRAWCSQKIEENPHEAEEINSYFVLAMDEIEAGESESHEIELCVECVNQLVGTHDHS